MPVALLLIGMKMPVCLYWLGLMLKLAYSTVELPFDLADEATLLLGWWNEARNKLEVDVDEED